MRATLNNASCEAFLCLARLFHAFWHVSGDTGRLWNESGGHRVSRASAGAPSTLVVALQLRTLTSHYLHRVLANCCKMPAFLGPRTADYRSTWTMIYVLYNVFTALVEYSLIMCDCDGKFWPVVESTARFPSVVDDCFGVDWGTCLTCYKMLGALLITNGLTVVIQLKLPHSAFYTAAERKKNMWMPSMKSCKPLHTWLRPQLLN